MSTARGENKEKKKRSLLREHYGVDEDGLGESRPKEEPLFGEICDPFDLKSPEFNADMYLNKLLKESNLSQLMDKEQQLYRQIQSLDSEMQTLVYENYNKFISATETIRKMSSNFDKMEEELNLLSSNMAEITDCSDQISNNLKTRRQDLTKLCGTHSVLRKLQFLFELPPRMQLCIQEKAFNEAVKYYLKAEKALEQYRHFPSIQVIDDECQAILARLKEKLYQQFASQEATQHLLAESIELLLQLQESPHVLAKEFLSFSGKRLKSDLTGLEYQVDLCKRSVRDSDSDVVPVDILEFVDIGCNGFLSNLAAVIVSYDDLFIKKLPEYAAEEAVVEQLSQFVDQFVADFVEQVKARVGEERPLFSESTFFVRALDRFYRRLQGLNKVYPSQDFSAKGLKIVEEAGQNQCVNALDFLKSRFTEELTSARHAIVNGPPAQQLYSSSSSEKHSLSELLITVETSISEQIKSAVAGLIAFLQPEISFLRRTHFQETFMRNVREGVVIGFFRQIIHFAEEYQKLGTTSTAPSQLILLLSRLCLDLETSVIGYLLAFVDEQFNVTDKHSLTALCDLCQEAKQAAQKLLNFYVRIEGQTISQMIKKSVETRDWLSSVEPRSVRSVMKRVVEDVSLIDAKVGELYEEGPRMERSSDSSRSRRTFSAMGLTTRHKTTAWSAYGPSTIDTNLMSNIQKLFSEKIEIFGPVMFSKLSVVTGVIKIGLKTLVECVRLCTFSRFGLQQVQVDSYYLQTHLWRFVSDENLVHSLLDEVLVSAVHRSLEPVMMEMSVVEKICEGL